MKDTAFYRARVSVLSGDRRLCDFMANAGLGITGAGVREIMTLDYKPGEVVDAARVEKAMEAMIKASDAENSEVKILHYKVLDVTLITAEDAGKRQQT